MAIKEKCDLFKTIDERHILDNQVRERLSILIRTANPIDALGSI
ncbi:MAG: hypothetical protein ACUVTL_09380 [Thermoproteota archaeon]